MFASSSLEGQSIDLNATEKIVQAIKKTLISLVVYFKNQQFVTLNQSVSTLSGCLDYIFALTLFSSLVSKITCTHIFYFLPFSLHIKTTISCELLGFEVGSLSGSQGIQAEQRTDKCFIVKLCAAFTRSWKVFLILNFSSSFTSTKSSLKQVS